MRKTHHHQPSLIEPWLDLEHAKELQAISEILDKRPEINELILHDLQRAAGSREPTGAHGLSAEQVMRALIVKQLNSFSYRDLAFHLADSRSYQTFCRIGLGETPPSKSALQATIKALSAETLERINRILVRGAVGSKVESGRTVRVDCTVVESNIHRPVDSEQLWDSVRVVVRLMKKARKVLGSELIVFSDRTRRAKRCRYEINNTHLQRKREPAYRDLLKVANETYAFGIQVRQVLAQPHDIDPVSAGILDAVAGKLDRYLPLMHRVIDQTHRRIVESEKVPATDKVLSIFEDHTDVISKGGRDTFYGHKICLTAGRSSMVLDCVVLDGNPADSTLSVEMIKRQVKLYGRAPKQAVFDGAFASAANLESIKDIKGVQDVVFCKGNLAISDMAKSSWVYRSLRKFRAGIEGIISFLKRTFGLDRCTWRSRASFHSYVWSSILTCNLMVMARHQLA
jgi:IS5 family transposase